MLTCGCDCNRCGHLWSYIHEAFLCSHAPSYRNLTSAATWPPSGFTCPLKPWCLPAVTFLSHHPKPTSPSPPRPPSLWVPPLPVSLSNGISLFRLNSGCCSVSWWCLHGQFVPLIPRNGPPLPGPAEGQWGQHCQPGLRNGRQLHCLQHSQQ